jgi:hypothetical protein
MIEKKLPETFFGKLFDKRLGPGFYWWRLRCIRHYYWHEWLPWKIAWALPPKIALYAFVRVFSIKEPAGPDYEFIYKMWEHRYLKKEKKNEEARSS